MTTVTTWHEMRSCVTTKYLESLDRLGSKYSHYMDSILQQKECVKLRLKQHFEQQVEVINQKIQSSSTVHDPDDTALNAMNQNHVSMNNDHVHDVIELELEPLVNSQGRID